MVLIEQAFDEQAFDADLGAFVPLYGEQRPPRPGPPQHLGSPSTLRRSPIAAKATLPSTPPSGCVAGYEALRDGDHDAARDRFDAASVPHHFAYKEGEPMNGWSDSSTSSRRVHVILSVTRRLCSDEYLTSSGATAVPTTSTRTSFGGDWPNLIHGFEYGEDSRTSNTACGPRPFDAGRRRGGPVHPVACPARRLRAGLRVRVPRPPQLRPRSGSGGRPRRALAGRTTRCETSSPVDRQPVGGATGTTASEVDGHPSNGSSTSPPDTSTRTATGRWSCGLGRA